MTDETQTPTEELDDIVFSDDELEETGEETSEDETKDDTDGEADDDNGSEDDDDGNDVNDNGNEDDGDSDDNKDQTYFDKRIGEKHRQLMEEKRAREASEARIAELERRLAPETKRPVIPELPDPYDADFDTQMAARDAAIIEAAKYDAKQESAQSEKQKETQRQQAESLKELQKSVQTYAGRANKLGVSANALKVAGETVATYGVTDDITTFILGDDHGPLITTYLARNPSHLDKLRNMNPMQAGIYLQNEIKPKAMTGKSNRRKAPPPPKVLKGGGPGSKDDGPEGATFT